MHVAFHQHVVGRDARLPAIGELHAMRRAASAIGVRSDDAGAFSSQLERDGVRVFRAALRMRRACRDGGSR